MRFNPSRNTLPGEKDCPVLSDYGRAFTMSSPRAKLPSGLDLARQIIRFFGPPS
jgi:hypothetical protein